MPNKPTTIRAIGNSYGVTLPKAALERLRVKEGDAVYVVETPDGLLLTPHDPDFEESMRIVDDLAARYRNALRELGDR